MKGYNIIINLKERSKKDMVIDKNNDKAKIRN